MRVLFLSLFLVLAACGSPSDEVEPPVQSTAPASIKTPALKKPTLSPEANGKKFYKKCVACHLANGDGIPGAFPPLNSGMEVLASTEAGRTYLILVIYNGLRGSLQTESGTYNSVMVRQSGGKSPADIADVLNHVLNNFYPDKTIKAFTAEEVKSVNEGHGRIGGDKVLALRPKVDG